MKSYFEGDYITHDGCLYRVMYQLYSTICCKDVHTGKLAYINIGG